MAPSKPYPTNHNPGVPDIPFFTPQHAVSPGVPFSNLKNAVEGKKVPVLFTPLTIRGVTLRNRILVAPMCQYSCAAEGELVGALTVSLDSCYLFPFRLMSLGFVVLDQGCAREAG